MRRVGLPLNVESPTRQCKFVIRRVRSNMCCSPRCGQFRGWRRTKSGHHGASKVTAPISVWVAAFMTSAHNARAGPIRLQSPSFTKEGLAIADLGLTVTASHKRLDRSWTQ